MPNHSISIPSLGFSRRAALALAACALLTAGCRDKQEVARKMAEPAVDALLPLIERDVKQIRSGLPEGAKILAKHLDEDPSSDPEGVRRALQKARAGVHDLAVAKGTFFIFVSPKGVVLRGESDPDLAADKSLLDAVPETKALLQPGHELKEAWGYMEGLRGVNKGGDLEWIVGYPVMRGEDHLGTFVTGWSLRAYARVLELALTAHLDKARDPDATPPLAYPFILKDKQAFGGPVVPEENMKAVAEMGILDTLKGADVFRRDVEIDGRPFYAIAKKVPSLGDDVALVLLLSGV